MKNPQKMGGVSALYLAAAYAAGIVLFLFVLDYPSIVEPAQKAALLVDKQLVIYLTNLIVYVVFGVFPVGVVGILATVPGLNDMAGLFGRVQILWFVWLGIVLLRRN